MMQLNLPSRPKIKQPSGALHYSILYDEKKMFLKLHDAGDARGLLATYTLARSVVLCTC